MDWVGEALLLAPVPMAVVANLGLRHELARLFTLALVLALGSVTAAVAVYDLSVDAAGLGGPAGAAVQIAAGLLVCALVLPGVAQFVRRLVPIEPGQPVHLLALGLALLLMANGVSSALADTVAKEAGSAQALSRVDLVLGEIPFLLAALAGVGLLVRRAPARALGRLGLVVPRWWHVVLGLAAAGLFFGVGTGLDVLGQWLTPGTSQQVSTVTNRLFGGLTSDPGGVATIALAAGICEEILFRGALQPRLGVVGAALVFASVHTQYGVSFDELAVLLLALGLGLLRRYLNTTTAIVCHTAYDALAGVGLTAALVPWALAVEAALIAVLGLALWQRPRGGPALQTP